MVSNRPLVTKDTIEPSPCHHIGINSEDKLHDPSLLSKFRTTRLSETTLDNILAMAIGADIKKETIKPDQAENMIN